MFRFACLAAFGLLMILVGHAAHACWVEPEPEAACKPPAACVESKRSEAEPSRAEAEPDPGGSDDEQEDKITPAEARLIREIHSAIGGRTGRDLNIAAREAVNRDRAADRPRLFRTYRGTEIDAVYDELLQRSLGVPTYTLTRPDPDIRRFARFYNRRMRQLLAAEHGAARLELIGDLAALEAAERDIQVGELRLWLFGLPMPSDSEYQRLLNDRFGIELRFGGCILPEGFDVSPYNRRMRKEIELRFGAGILERTQEEARRRQEEQAALRCVVTAQEDAAPNAID